jgi:hypothetical protein
VMRRNWNLDPEQHAIYQLQNLDPPAHVQPSPRALSQLQFTQKLGAPGGEGPRH